MKQDSHMNELMKASGLGDVKRVKKLLKEEFSPLLLDPISGTSALHFAAQSGNVETAKVLVESGALINLHAESNNLTPLMTATWYRNVDMIKYLLSLEHINPLKKNHLEQTAADFPAIANGKTELDPIDKEIVAVYNAYFKQRNIYIDATFEVDGYTPKNIRKDANTHVLNGNQGNDYHTPTLVASRTGELELFQELLDNGADITLIGEYMKANVAHKAGYMGNPEIMKLIVNHPDFDKIKDAQGPTNGYTPIHDAVWHGHTETTKILLEVRVDLDIKGWDGLTPLDLAKKYNYTEIIELFENRKEVSDESSGV